MTKFVERAAVWAAALLLCSACDGGVGRSPDAAVEAAGVPRILLNQSPSGSRIVDVVGLPAVLLSRLEQNPPSGDQWTALLRVTVAGAAGQASDLPALLGRYS